MRTRLEVTIPVILSLLLFGPPALATVVAVDCDQGQTITAALAGLAKSEDHQINISGTCREFVSIEDFRSLTLSNSSQEGEIVSPLSPPPPGEEWSWVPMLGISSSKVMVWGIRIAGLGRDAAGPTAVVAVGNRSNVQFWECTIEDGRQDGLNVNGEATVILTESTVRNNGGNGVSVEHARLQVGDWWRWVPGRETAIRGNAWHGIEIRAGAQVNGIASPSAPVISENQQHGIVAWTGGTMWICCASSEFPENAFRAVDNGWAGLTASQGGTLSIWGGAVVEGNDGAGIAASFTGHFGTSGPVLVRNNDGPGVVADHSSSVALWGGITVTGNTGPGVSVSTVSSLHNAAGNSVYGNGAEDLRCSPSSAADGVKTGFGKIKCPGFED